MLAAMCMITAILVGGGWPPACDPSSPDRVDIAFLSSDAYFLIGEEKFVLPFVAVRWVSRPEECWNDAFDEGDVSLDRRHRLMTEIAADPSDPMPAAHLEIAIEPYQFYGEQLASMEICPRLSREWAQGLCRGQRPGIVADLPRRFELVDRRFLSQLKNKWASGQETVADRIAEIEPLPLGHIGFSCGETEDCTAAAAVSAGVLVIWEMHAAGGETVAQTSERQGAAILAFARHAIGEREISTD